MGKQNRAKAQEQKKNKRKKKLAQRLQKIQKAEDLYREQSDEGFMFKNLMLLHEADSGSDAKAWIFFRKVQPELAETETRSIALFKPLDKIPIGSYLFEEAYCASPTCDCQRVLFHVIRTGPPSRDTLKEMINPTIAKHLFTISYHWENPAPSSWLDRFNPFSKDKSEALIEKDGLSCGYEDQLLEVFKMKCLSSNDFVNRIKRHYALCRAF